MSFITLADLGQVAASDLTTWRNMLSQAKNAGNPGGQDAFKQADVMFQSWSDADKATYQQMRDFAYGIVFGPTQAGQSAPAAAAAGVPPPTTDTGGWMPDPALKSAADCAAKGGQWNGSECLTSAPEAFKGLLERGERIDKNQADERAGQEGCATRGGTWTPGVGCEENPCGPMVPKPICDVVQQLGKAGKVVAVVAALGLGVYLFGPAVRKRLNKGSRRRKR